MYYDMYGKGLLSISGGEGRVILVKLYEKQGYFMGMVG